jgi:hypothetical protein
MFYPEHLLKGAITMTADMQPYFEFEPGMLITAEDQNSVQRKIKEDIRSTVDKAIDDIKVVKRAESADKLNDQTLEQLIAEITRRVLDEVQKRSGYLNVFRRLRFEALDLKDMHRASSIIKHNLGAFPLVDVYRLDYFPAIISEDGEKFFGWLLFYIYHGSEKRIRYTGTDEKNKTKTIQLEIERTEDPMFKISFKELLDLLKVEYADETTLSEVENAFWAALFSDPNDNFDDDQYGHSPWFDKCCGDERTVGSLRSDWDNIWVKIMPRKTINYAGFSVAGDNERDGEPFAPNDVRVMHADRNTVALKLLKEPGVPPHIPDTSPTATPFPARQEELPVMVILKV